MIKILSYFFFLFAMIGHATERPVLTTTAIIEIYEQGQFQGIVLIERGKAPFGKAIPGGKVEYGETVENAVRREMWEEVNLPLEDLRQFQVYSDPKRDFRHHSVEVAHIAKAYQLPTAGDDAAKAFVVKLEEIPWTELAFDHAQVLRDYIEWRSGHESLAMPYFSRFEALAKAEKWKEIIEEGTAALDLAVRENRVYDQAKICAQLTSSCFYLGDYKQALFYANRCHKLSENFIDPSLYLRALYLESAVHRANKDFSKAVEIAEEALRLYTGLNHPQLLSKIYFNLGAAHADNPTGNLAEASRCYFAALASSPTPDDLVRLNIRLAKVYLLQKDYSRSQQIIDQTRPHITSERLAMHADYLEAQLKLALNDTEAALQLIEKGLIHAKALGAKEDELRLLNLIPKNP